VKGIRNAYAAFVAALELMAAELTAGRKLVEAVAIDEADAELEAITGRKDGALELRLMALDLGKLGITRDEVMDMARIYHAVKYRRITDEDIVSLGQITMRRTTQKEPL
jgi:hypothetical protein